MARIQRSVVSTIVLILISNRELVPLAIFKDFLKIEMALIPSVRKYWTLRIAGVELSHQDRCRSSRHVC
jgi:hypothetical protein